MASRPSWTGNLRLSLVTFQVELYTGAKPIRNIPLHLIHKPTGKRVHNQTVVEGVGAVKRDSIVKGYEYKKDKYVVLTPEEIDKIRLPTNKTINITEFVDQTEVDEIYYDRPYYIVPKGDIAVEAYAVFHQALKKTGKIAIGEVVLSGKEHLVSIKPYGKGMLLETLRYADEVRSAHQYFEDLSTPKADKEQLDLATTLIKKKTAKFKPDDFDDSYETALHELIERKLKKLPLEREEEKDTGKVISLMDALKKSVGGKTTKASSAKKKTTAKKVAAKRKRA
jgi:DNA end-binding protein Ku